MLENYFENSIEEQLLDYDVKASLVASHSKKKEEETEGQLTVDVYQTEDEIVIVSTVAGVTAKDIDISITNDMVTIKGNRVPEVSGSKGSYDVQELYWGKFARSIILPEEIDSDKARASMKNGILTLRMPKLAKTRIKKLKIT